MKNNFLKGLVMTIVAFICAYMSDSIESGIQWNYVLISTIGISLTYIGKNAIYQSSSPSGTLDFKDMISGVIIAVGTAISTGAANWITEGSIDWKAMFAAVVAVVIGYFSKTLTTNSGKISKK